jgi:hypothetical protein
MICSLKKLPVFPLSLSEMANSPRARQIHSYEMIFTITRVYYRTCSNPAENPIDFF